MKTNLERGENIRSVTLKIRKDILNYSMYMRGLEIGGLELN